jgi:hypothetical protein
VHSGISGFASSFNWKLTDNINNSTFPTQLAGQAGQLLTEIHSMAKIVFCQNGAKSSKKEECHLWIKFST